VSNPTADNTTKSAWPRAAIFDFDGTLADTTSRWAAAYQGCLGRRGRTIDEPTLRALAGASVPDAARALDIPPDELAAALAGAFRAQPLTEMPGATVLVRALSPHTRLAIASNGPAALVRLGLDQLGLRPYFDAIVSAEDAGAFKPAPDVYLHAAAEVGLRPWECVAIEDSAVGIQAAKGAGLPVIYISASAHDQGAADLHAPQLDDTKVMCYLSAKVTVPTG
jgi:HAD superfamily hydrolase (TIGR01509 family)